MEGAALAMERSPRGLPSMEGAKAGVVAVMARVVRVMEVAVGAAVARVKEGEGREVVAADLEGERAWVAVEAWVRRRTRSRRCPSGWRAPQRK